MIRDSCTYHDGITSGVRRRSELHMSLVPWPLGTGHRMSKGVTLPSKSRVYILILARYFNLHLPVVSAASSFCSPASTYHKLLRMHMMQKCL